MPKRQSINGSKPRHENPIPNASRIGNLVMSSVIVGTNPGTRELPPKASRRRSPMSSPTFGTMSKLQEAASMTLSR